MDMENFSKETKELQKIREDFYTKLQLAYYKKVGDKLSKDEVELLLRMEGKGMPDFNYDKAIFSYMRDTMFNTDYGIKFYKKNKKINFCWLSDSSVGENFSLSIFPLNSEEKEFLASLTPPPKPKPFKAFDTKGKLTIGKYKEKNVLDICKCDPGYIEWCEKEIEEFEEKLKDLK